MSARKLHQLEFSGMNGRRRQPAPTPTTALTSEQADHVRNMPRRWSCPVCPATPLEQDALEHCHRAHRADVEARAVVGRGTVYVIRGKRIPGVTGH